MLSAKDIIRRGYFPKELPPPFSTDALADKLTQLPRTQKKNSYSLRYSYSKYASLRRTLYVPNAVHFIPLAEKIAEYWPKLKEHCANSPVSRTKPKLSTKRAIRWASSLDEIPVLRAKQRVGARYVMRADVESCYKGIYTHAIPWALHGKVAAKKDHSDKLYGNTIDRCSRNIQSGQTIGIPVGPDTSIPIAEAVLTAVDRIIMKRVKSSERFFRFVDDYEFVCDTLSEAEHVRTILQEALGEYELRLNPKKTRILELPQEMDTPWAHELSAFRLESLQPAVLKSQILRYFSRAFEIVKDNPGEPVLKYAVRRLSEIDCQSLANLIQRLLFQAAAVDPGTLQTVLYIAFQHKEEGISLDLDSITQSLTAIIRRHSELQHGGDVAWALWGAIVFNVHLGEKAITSLENLADPIAILMTLFAESKGVFKRKVRKKQWENLATPDEIFDRNWLVAYEAIGQGWLPNVTNDPAISDPFFARCRKLDIEFMNIDTPPKIPRPSNIGDYP